MGAHCFLKPKQVASKKKKKNTYPAADRGILVHRQWKGMEAMRIYVMECKGICL